MIHPFKLPISLALLIITTMSSTEGGGTPSHGRDARRSSNSGMLFLRHIPNQPSDLEGVYTSSMGSGLSRSRTHSDDNDKVSKWISKGDKWVLLGLSRRWTRSACAAGRR